jgi:hypothetical protein
VAGSLNNDVLDVRIGLCAVNKGVQICNPNADLYNFRFNHQLEKLRAAPLSEPYPPVEDWNATATP